jgi:hypothetical protein
MDTSSIGQDETTMMDVLTLILCLATPYGNTSVRKCMVLLKITLSGERFSFSIRVRCQNLKAECLIKCYIGTPIGYFIISEIFEACSIHGF